ncbi:hypothetical protein [Thioclava pacifica]|uniref:Uncharacterized protein n=1 Tax=Thioclava pacifica DSM 10166 TaxID=1353537 RepID=A0A074J5B3_9RHOB|nr:hypothetical protein [Thioclava pacifica]KEO50823.1 hypothetical protein TP2_14440 [Thioclava pacifica DSM 10166]
MSNAEVTRKIMLHVEDPQKVALDQLATALDAFERMSEEKITKLEQREESALRRQRQAG